MGLGGPQWRGLRRCSEEERICPELGVSDAHACGAFNPSKGKEGTREFLRSFRDAEKVMAFWTTCTSAQNLTRLMRSLLQLKEHLQHHGGISKK